MKTVINMHIFKRDFFDEARHYRLPPTMLYAVLNNIFHFNQ